MKKRLVSALVCAAMTAALLSGCGSSGSSDSSDSSDSSAEETAEEETAEETEEETAEETSEAASSGEEITLTIWDWDTTFSEHMTEYYQEQNPDSNVTFNVVAVSTDDYVQKLQSSLASGEGVPDVVLTEISYRGKVFDMGILDDLTQDPYNVNTDDLMDFAVDLGSTSDGTFVGIEQQIAPAGLAYNRRLALEYFGTDDPDELEEIFTDWDVFIEKGQEVLEQSDGTVYMMPGLASCAFYTLRYQTPASYITDTEIDITSRYSDIIDRLVEMNSAGIIMPGDTTASIAEGFINESFIFYPCAPWVAKWTIAENVPDDSGNWGLISTPEGNFTYGGTSISVYSGSEYKEEAWDYINFAYGEGGGLEESYELYGFMSCYKSLYGDDSFYFGNGAYNEFFGGQDLGLKFYEIQDGLQGQVQTSNESNVTTAISVVMAEYEANSSMTADDILQRLIEETQSLCTDVEVK